MVWVTVLSFGSHLMGSYLAVCSSSRRIARALSSLRLLIDFPTRWILISYLRPLQKASVTTTGSWNLASMMSSSKSSMYCRTKPVCFSPARKHCQDLFFMFKLAHLSQNSCWNAAQSRRCSGTSYSSAKSIWICFQVAALSVHNWRAHWILTVSEGNWDQLRSM